MRERGFDTDAGSTANEGRPKRARSFLGQLLQGEVRAWMLTGGGVGAIAYVLINALFLQTGPHPAPIFANHGPQSDNPVMLPRPRPGAIRGDLAVPGSAAVNQKITSARDAIGELLMSSKRVIAFQRALSEYGFGQVRPTGTIDAQTKTAIEEFERHRKLPVTGQISERVTRELAAMTGRSFD